MDLRFTPEQERFREEVRGFLSGAVTPELVERTHGMCEAFDADFHARLAERGWIGLQWPRDYGGQARSATDMAIFYEEMGLAMAPLGRYVATTVFVGGSILAYGSDEQKRRYLPRIAAGALFGSLAVTEPEAGSDAASLRTRATRRGDEYVLSGQKVFISGADRADLMLTAVRTDPDTGSKYEGISLLLVPAGLGGLEVRPLPNIAGLHVSLVTFDDVVVPASELLGEEGHGWRHLQTTFSLERSLQSAQLVGNLLRLYRDTLDVAAGAVEAGRLADERLAALYDCRAELEAARLLSYRATWLGERGGVPLDEAAVSKLTRSELALRLATVALELMGEAGLGADLGGPLGARVAALYRRVQFYVTAGGTNDIQRSLLAQHGLGLPRG